MSVGPRHGLDHDSVVSCGNITTVRAEAVGSTIGLPFDDQELELARAIGDAFDLFVPQSRLADRPLRHRRWLYC